MSDKHRIVNKKSVKSQKKKLTEQNEEIIEEGNKGNINVRIEIEEKENQTELNENNLDLHKESNYETGLVGNKMENYENERTKIYRILKPDPPRKKHSSKCCCNSCSYCECCANLFPNSIKQNCNCNQACIGGCSIF